MSEPIEKGDMRMRKTISLPLLFAAFAASAEFSFTYRGRLDMTGHGAVADLPLKVAVYPDSTGGPAAWTGLYTITPSADGAFQVQLAGEELEKAFRAGTAKWFGVTVGNGSEHYPRQQILVTPLAARADTAEGLARDATIRSLQTSKLTAKSVSAGAVTVSGALKATGSGSAFSSAELVGTGNLKLKGSNVQVFANAKPGSYEFENGVSEGDVLFLSDRGGLVTLITDSNWTAPCVTWFAGKGEVKAPFSASGKVRVYHYPFGAN